MSKFERGEYVVSIDKWDDPCFIKGKPYKVLDCDSCMVQLRDEDFDLRWKSSAKFRRMSLEEFSELVSIKEEFNELVSIKDELERVKKDNQAQESLIGEYVRHKQVLEREIKSLKHKLKTVHEVTSLIGGYE